MSINDVRKWAESNEVFSVSVKSEDGYFDPNGCDADPESLGNNVYDCEAICLDHKDNFECQLSAFAISIIVNGE